MEGEIEDTRIEAIIPMETRYSIQKTKPTVQEPIPVLAQMKIMVGNPMLAYIAQVGENPSELCKHQSSVVTAIYRQRERMFRVTTESGSEYILTIENS